MRIRLLRNIRMAGATSVELLAGSVVNAMPDVADKWIKQGVAMEDKSIEPKEAKLEETHQFPDKSLDGASETKAIPISVPKIRRKKK